MRVCAVAQANDYAETLQAVPAQSFTYVLLCHNTCTTEYRVRSNWYQRVMHMHSLPWCANQYIAIWHIESPVVQAVVALGCPFQGDTLG